MGIETRETKPSEYRPAADMLSVAYLQKPLDDERWAKTLPSWENMHSYASWDGPRCVGHGGQHEVETTVPGGALVKTGAITRVGVLPTHSRRGAGTAIMNALLDDAEARGWPLASLRASESVIYRRYGFGVAGEFADVTIESDRAKPVAGSTSGTMRLLAPDEIEDITRLVDGRALTRRPGLITRPDTWRAWHFQAAIERSKGALVALHSDSAGQPDGYTCYETEWGDVFGPGGTGKVLDVVALSDEVELDLWRYLFDVDLIQRWTAPGRPLDDLIREAVADRRAYATTAINDEQWLRLIDVDRALGARSFNPVAGSVVVEVRDPYFAANRGRWRIDGDGARSIDDPADLVASIDALSALYLGGMSWRTEAAVGRVEAGPGLDGVRHFDEMLTLSDLLFSVRPLPFCGTFF